MLALRVHGRTFFSARLSNLLPFDIRRAVEIFAANAKFLGAIGGS